MNNQNNQPHDHGSFSFKRDLPIYAFIAIHSVLISWWAATVTQRVVGVESWIKSQESVSDRLTRVEVTMANINDRSKDQGDRLERKLDDLIDIKKDRRK